MSRARRTVVVSSALTLALALTACGGGGGGGSTGSSAAPAGATVTPASPAASAVTDPVPTAPLTPAPTTPPVTTTPTTPPVTPTPVACDAGDAPVTRATAFSIINLTRQIVGFPLLTRVASLDGTAQAHAQYSAVNASTTVDETAGLPCFTGTTLQDRYASAGIVVTDVPNQRVRSEMLIGYGQSSLSAAELLGLVNESFHNLYSRAFLLDPRVQQVGLGFAAKGDGQRQALVLDTGVLGGGASVDASVWAVWPRDGTAGLPAQMRASNLKPLEAGIVEGYPATLHAAAVVKVTRFVMTVAASGQPVDATVMTVANDRNGILTAGEAALVPRAPLAAGTTYRIEFDGSIGGTPLHQVWSFTTAP